MTPCMGCMGCTPFEAQSLDNVVYLLDYMHHLRFMVNRITEMLNTYLIYMNLSIYTIIPILFKHFKYDQANSTIKYLTIFDVSFIRKLASLLLKIRQLQGDFAPLVFPHSPLCAVVLLTL